MSAQILPFHRAAVLHRGLNVDEALRRVRMGARAAGASVHQVEAAQRYAVRLWCDAALNPQFVIERAIDYARQLIGMADADTGPHCA